MACVPIPGGRPVEPAASASLLGTSPAGGCSGSRGDAKAPSARKLYRRIQYDAGLEQAQFSVGLLETREQAERKSGAEAWSLRVRGSVTELSFRALEQRCQDAGEEFQQFHRIMALLFEPAGDAFSHDLIFTGGTDCTIKVWSGSASGQLLGQHVGHSGQVTCLALDGSVLFSGSQDTTIGVFDALPQSFAPAAGAGGSLPPPGGLGSSVASSSPAGRTPGCVPAPPASAAFRVLRGHAAAVTGLQVVARTGVVVSCGRDGRLLQWNYVTGQLLASQTLAPAHELTCVAVHQRGGGVLVGSAGGQVLSAATLQAGADGGVAAAQAAAALQQGSAEALLQLLHKPRASGG